MKAHQKDPSDLLETAARLFSHSLVDSLRRQGADILETGAGGVFFTDQQGNRILDGHSGAAMYNLGRRHPEIAEALRRAGRVTDQGNFVAVSEEKALLAHRLARFMPDPLSCFLFTVVRGEAMDAACKLARGKTGRSRLLAADGGYHGDTGFALSLSDVPVKAPFGSLIPGIETIGFNDTDAVKRIDDTCAAVILELMQVENGCRGAERHWVRQLRRRCDDTGTLMILDETQTGFGRTGETFLFRKYGITPDILVFGEAVTGGMFPMTGMAFSPGVKTFFDEHPLIHLCTFGGHDVGCRTAMAAVDIYDRDRPWENARIRGEQIMAGLTPLAERHPDVRGLTGTGLLLGLCFETEPHADRFCHRAMKNGLFLVKGIIAPETVIIRPPLTLSAGETELLVDRLAHSLED